MSATVISSLLLECQQSHPYVHIFLLTIPDHIHLHHPILEPVPVSSLLLSDHQQPHVLWHTCAWAHWPPCDPGPRRIVSWLWSCLASSDLFSWAPPHCARACFCKIPQSCWPLWAAAESGGRCQQGHTARQTACRVWSEVRWGLGYVIHPHNIFLVSYRGVILLAHCCDGHQGPQEAVQEGPGRVLIIRSMFIIWKLRLTHVDYAGKTKHRDP